MAAPCDSLIEDFMQNDDGTVPKKLSQTLVNGKISLTDIIENLGGHMTNTEVEVRKKATQLIADILHQLSHSFLSHNQVSLLSTYLCEKLKDHAFIHPPALYGLEALSRCDLISREIIELICRTIFKEVHAQSLPQSSRRSVYKILFQFLTGHLKDVQVLGTDFVYGFIQCMDSEQDPRNLVIAFTCAHIIIQHLPLGVFVEEIFEVVSCYFPIDFTPPSNDPSGITQEDLILGLRKCLSASPKFAQYCLPLLMEKLTSDMKSAKIDALYTLASCAAVYGSEKMFELQMSFFNCIKKEMFLSGDTKVEEAAITALTALIKTASTGLTQSDRKKSLEGFIEDILNECKSHLLQPELMLMKSTGRLLQAVATGSADACSQVAMVTIPLLIESYNKQTQHTPKHNVIIVLNKISETIGTFKFGNQSPLQSMKEPVLCIYGSAIDIDVTSIQVLAVKGLYLLVSLHNECLTDVDKTNMADKCLNKVTASQCETEIRSECNILLSFLLSTFPDLIQPHVYPVLFNKLHNDCMDVDDKTECDKTVILNILSEITSGLHNVKIVTQLLYKLLIDKEYLDLYVCITECLYKISTRCTDIDSVLYLCEGVKLIHQIITTHCRCPRWYNVLTNTAVISNISSFLRQVAAHWSHTVVNDIQSLYTESFLKTVSCKNCECCSIEALAQFQSNPESFCPLKPGCDCVFISVLSPIICCGPAKLQKDIPNIEEIQKYLHDLIFEPLDSVPYEYICKCVAGLLNKQEQNESLDTLLLKLLDNLSGCLCEKGNENSCYGNKQCVAALAWISKALIMRGHKLSEKFSDLLVSLLCHQVYGCLAADGFSIILTDNDDILNKSMQANIRMMYKQRFFLENLDKIVHNYHTADSDVKMNYLSALSHMLKNTNKSVILPELSKLYPLLIQSLLSNDLDLQLVTMDTLTDLIFNASNVIEKQLDSLIPQLLKMCVYKQSLKVRVSALKCLTQLTNLPLHKLLPYRNKVVRSLVPVLDDRKRLVRNEAVIARQEWILMDMDEDK
ncbi:mms19 nucleotide excision repair [Mactra antiquata]